MVGFGAFIVESSLMLGLLGIILMAGFTINKLFFTAIIPWIGFVVILIGFVKVTLYGP